MEVVLLERIEKLGIMGDVVTVKDGYARNFLLPQNKALRATKENLEQFEQQRAQLEARNLEQRKEAEAVAARMEGASIVVVRQASESDHLYGSVSVRDIADALGEAGFTIDRTQVALDRPIKTTGISTVRIALHPEVAVDVTVNVARSSEEAELQASQTEEDVLAEAQAVFESEELVQQAVEDLVETEEDEAEAVTGDEEAPVEAVAAEETAADADAEDEQPAAPEGEDEENK